MVWTTAASSWGFQGFFTMAAMGRLLARWSSSDVSGSGVGLALCKEIVEAHAGRIRLENRLGGGLVVTCWLPAGPTAARGGPDAAEDAASAELSPGPFRYEG